MRRLYTDCIKLNLIDSIESLDIDGSSIQFHYVIIQFNF